MYKMQVLQEQEKAIAGMNIPPVDLLKQVQGGDVYSRQTPIRSYEDVVMATAFMPGMFNDEEAIPEFKLRIVKRQCHWLKRLKHTKIAPQILKRSRVKLQEKWYRSMARKCNLIDCQNQCLTG